MATTRDVTRLPKWAQSEIRTLQMRLREAEERLADHAPSKVNAQPYSNQPQWLDDDACVEFASEGGRVTVGIKRDQQGEFVEIYGNESFVITPQSSNVIKVRCSR